MNLVLVSDSFKGSLTSKEANSIIENAARKVFDNCQCQKLTIADGGEGTLEAIMGEENESGYEKITLEITGPLGKKIESSYIRKGNRAVIEMAAASGLPLVEKKKRNPLFTTTKGTGELLHHALKNGCTDIYIGIGGSATNDGGTGAMEALGFQFLDRDGKILSGIGQNLSKIDRIDDSKCMKEIYQAKFTVMCDVVNPLTGDSGATYVYGPQKGGTKEILDELEKGMLNYQNILEVYSGQSIKEVPGLGAAGGLGAALYVFLHADMKSGIEILLDLHNFDSLLEDTDIVITGEGKTDYQSAYGKVIYGIAKRCKQKNKPLFVISGCLEGKLDSLYEIGVTSMEASVCNIMNVKDAMANAELYLYQAAERVFRVMKAIKELT